jgi:hypothetical protein
MKELINSHLSIEYQQELFDLCNLDIDEYMKCEDLFLLKKMDRIIINALYSIDTIKDPFGVYREVLVLDKFFPSLLSGDGPKEISDKERFALDFNDTLGPTGTRG